MSNLKFSEDQGIPRINDLTLLAGIKPPINSHVIYTDVYGIEHMGTYGAGVWEWDVPIPYTPETLPDPASLPSGTVVTLGNPGFSMIVSGGKYFSLLNYCISVNAIGNDHTEAFQEAVSSGKSISLVAGQTYRISDTIVCPSDFDSTRIFGNGAKIQDVFGTNYSKPVFKNDTSTDDTCRLELHDLEVGGNCLVVKQEFTSNNPNSGLSLVINRLNYNSGDGNRRPGTGIVVASSIDFVEINKVVAWNADIGLSLGRYYQNDIRLK